MRTIPTSIVLSVCALATGCVFQQKVALAPPQPVAAGAGIDIEIADLRDNLQKTTHVEGHPHCFRAYGDDFIVPTKIEYFQRLIESRAPPHTHAKLAVKRFETVEWCDKTASQVISGGVYGATKGLFDVIPRSTGNSFGLHIVGTINGAPFDVFKEFDYDDVKFLNFPSESPEYRQRLDQALQSAADDVLAAGGKTAGGA